jgi:putative transposase
MSRCLFYFHVVWATQYRQPLLTAEREQAVFRLIMATAYDLGAEVLAVNGMPDHIHVLIKTGAVVDMPHMMKQIKGVTSAMLNRLMQPTERFRWQSGYYSATVTPSHAPKIAAYIQSQKEHHAAGTTHHFWEQTEETEEKT